MAGYIELNAENFEATTSKGVALVDFWAPWCGPCKMISPVIDKLAADYAGKAAICKVNTDEQDELSTKFGIRSVPTLLFMKDGEVKDTVIGAVNEQTLREKIDALL